MTMRDDQQYWLDIFSKWESSGQAQKPFCLAQQLSYKQFCKWRHRLIAQGLIKASPKAPGNHQSISRSGDQDLDFMPISLKASQEAPATKGPHPEGSGFEIELQLPAGIKLHIRSGL